MSGLEESLNKANLSINRSLVKELSRTSYLLSVNIDRFEKERISGLVSDCRKIADQLPTEKPDIKRHTIKTKGKTYKETIKKIAEYINILSDELNEKLDNISNDEFYNYKRDIFSNISEMELVVKEI